MLVHKLGFVEYKDSTIHQIEASSNSKLSQLVPVNALVATLKDSIINIYLGAHLIHSIQGSFSHVKITEYYLVTVSSLCIELRSLDGFAVVSTTTLSSPVWAIDVCLDVLAVASQNIHLYTLPSIDSEVIELELTKTIPFPHKPLTLALTPTTLYVSTTTSSLHTISTSKGQSLARVNLKRKQICWDILALKDVIVCGMSDGSVWIYARHNFSFMQSVKGHLADVLCLSVDNSEQEKQATKQIKKSDTFFSSGVDRVVVQYKLITTADTSKWIVAGEKRLINTLSFV